ncbi:MAG: hybrid sensor histidine kinase/response regulator [bacterium]
MQFSDKEFSEVVQIFESEIQDNISNINKLLLILEKDNNDSYAIQELFREAHSIKGAARMVGFLDIQNLAHAFENVMTMRKNNEIVITPEIVELLFSAIDYMEITIGEIIKTKGQYKTAELEQIIRKLNFLDKKSAAEKPSPVEYIAVNQELKLQKKEDENLDEFMDDLFGNQDNNEQIQKITAKLQKLNKDSLPPIYEKLMTLLEKIQMVNYSPDDDLLKEIKNAYGIIKDISKGKEAPKENLLLLEKRLMILNEIVGVSKPETLEDIVASIADNSSMKTLRVDSNKLDRLIKQVGELIVAKVKNQEHLKEIERVSTLLEGLQKQWSKSKYQINRKTKDYEKMYKSLSNASEEAMYTVADLIEQVGNLYRVVQEDDTKLSFIVGDLENIIKGIRMLPFSTVFHMFPRMIKDLASEKGKQAELLILGSEITADKKIIDEIKIPLIHILRNSVDHGIETPQERLEKGKNPTGKIILKVKYENNNIIIEVSDDGRGLNIEEIKNKVIEKGFLNKPELDVMTQNQIMNIIFWPGFSTQNEVSEISGRGVGMDVVHNKISQLNGNIYVKSEQDKNFALTIKIPVAMSTINALIVDIGGQKYALSTSSVSSAKKIDTSKLFLKDGRQNIAINGKNIPVFDMATLLDIPNREAKESGKMTLLILKEEENEVGFIIERIVGEQEILQKNLAAPLMQVKNLSGLTTLSTGDICLILNSHELINMALHSKQLSLRKSQSQDLFNAGDYNLLVVEDSHTTRTLQKNILTNTGYNVDTAQSGEIAFAKISKKQYDLIVSDIEMPGMSGFELFEKINKEIENGKKIKKVIVSFLDSDEVQKQSQKSGIDAFMSKSTFAQSDFLNTIRHLLGE